MKNSCYIQILALILVAFILAGCASLSTRTSTFPSDQATGKLYPGVQDNLKWIKEMAPDLIDPEWWPLAWFFVSTQLIDVPLSFAVDTVCFPYDFQHRNYSATTHWYGNGGTYRILKTDPEGKLHGKCSYCLTTDKGAIWGETRYRHGELFGIAEATGSPLPAGRIHGEFQNNKPWDGTFLLHALNTNKCDVGLIFSYQDGVLVTTSNVFKKILK